MACQPKLSLETRSARLRASRYGGHPSHAIESEGWRRGWDSFGPRHKTRMKTGLFRLSLTTAAICRLRILSSAFVYLLPLASLASAMTLKMTLDAKDFPNLLRERECRNALGTSTRSRPRHRPTQTVVAVLASTRFPCHRPSSRPHSTTRDQKERLTIQPASAIPSYCQNRVPKPIVICRLCAASGACTHVETPSSVRVLERNIEMTSPPSNRTSQRRPKYVSTTAPTATASALDRLVVEPWPEAF